MTRILLAFLALACCVQLAHAQAQKYPSRPVRLIVPVYRPDGTTCTVYAPPVGSGPVCSAPPPVPTTPETSVVPSGFRIDTVLLASVTPVTPSDNDCQTPR